MTPREVPPYPQSGGPTLIEVLDRLGYATRPARWQGKKEIVRDGRRCSPGPRTRCSRGSARRGSTKETDASETDGTPNG